MKKNNGQLMDNSLDHVACQSKNVKSAKPRNRASIAKRIRVIIIRVLRVHPFVNVKTPSENSADGGVVVLAVTKKMNK